MIGLPANTRVWIVAGHTDMRKGFDGLAAMVQTALSENPFSGHVFVFRGRRGDIVRQPPEIGPAIGDDEDQREDDLGDGAAEFEEAARRPACPGGAAEIGGGSEAEQEAADGVKEIMLDKKFGASGNHVVVEEFLTGPEVSVLSFTDGKVVKPMVSSMDHKRANDHDTGLNTGGMGTIAPNPYYTPAIAAECMEKIFLPTIQAMNAEGCPFKGCLYFGLMLTPDGPKVIEYNCRFGDPETQVVLPLLESDLLKIMAACTEGTLADTEVKFSEGAACCVILASGGYPVSYEKGKPISGLTNGQLEGESNITVYHSGTALREDGTLVTNGGRVLGVTATAPRLTAAITQAYAAAEKISFEKLHKRSDIGLRALKALAEKE